MSAVVSRRTGLRVLLVAGALALAPVLVAGPAHAETSTPTPIASEPPGGATCLPGTSATCGQDTGSTPTPTPTKKAGTTKTVTSLPSTGGTPTGLAHTGGGAANGWGYSGTGLLVGGSLLVLVARRPRRA